MSKNGPPREHYSEVRPGLRGKKVKNMRRLEGFHQSSPIIIRSPNLKNQVGAETRSLVASLNSCFTMEKSAGTILYISMENVHLVSRAQLAEKGK